MKLSLILAACATLVAAAVTESTASFAATENMSFPKDVFITSRKCSRTTTTVLSSY